MTDTNKQGGADKKGIGKTLKILLLLTLASFGGCVALVIYLASSPKTDHDAKLSPEEFKKHADNILVFMDHVLITKGPKQIYALALNHKGDKYIASCDYSGCSEYRAFLRDVMKASEDGFLSPKEIKDIQEYAALVRQAIAKGNADLSNRLKKQDK